MARSVLVVGIGGTATPRSPTEKALKVALHAAEAIGAETLLFGGRVLARLPLYDPLTDERTDGASALVEAVRRADGVIVAAPGYHGAVAGLVKNALDYLEDLRDDEPPYLSGRAVGCVASAAGWQAALTTLIGIRTLVHALGGWPTPLGAAINTRTPLSGLEGSDRASSQLRAIGVQVVEFTEMRRAWLHADCPRDARELDRDLLRDAHSSTALDIAWMSEELCAAL